MSDDEFLDTNIMIYAADTDPANAAKTAIAVDLLQRRKIHI